MIRHQRPILSLVALAVFILLFGGCGTKPVQPVTSPETGRLLQTGYFPPHVVDASMVYFRIRFDDGKTYRVTEISPTRILPTSNAEEILGFDLARNMVGPAYSISMPNSESTSHGVSFACAFFGPDKKAEYHPCGAGSRFVKTSIGTTVFVNLLLVPLTLGTGAGVVYYLNDEAIRKVATELKLDRLANRYAQIKQYAEELNQNLDRQDRSLSRSLKPRLTLLNRTGFQLPSSVSNYDLGLTLARQEKVEHAGSLRYDGNDNIFSDAQAQMKDRYDAIVKERNFNVTCSSHYTASGFDGGIVCPNTFRYSSPLDAPEISVTINTVSFGTRYPSMQLKDRNISAEVSDGKLFISNLSNSFIEIKSISVYGGKEIKGTFVDRSLSPQGTNKEPYFLSQLASSPIISMFTFNSIRKSQIEGKAVDFGIAIKYRVGGGGNFESLFKKDRFRIESLLNN